MEVTNKRPLGFVIVLSVLYAVTIAAFLYALVDGWRYYSLSAVSRIHDPMHTQLKPGGLRGHAYGIIGSAMMLLMLLYSARKRWPFMRKWGSLPRWLDIHIFLGIAGPLFVILHSTFQFNGLVSVSFWSMIAVALSGVLGRFLYLQIPRNIRGAEMTMEEVSGLKEKINAEILQSAGADMNLSTQIKRQVIKESARDNLFNLFLQLAASKLTFRFRRKKITRQVSVQHGIPKSQTRQLITLILQKDFIDRRIRLWTRIHRYFHYWHVFHKPFAIIMFLIMFVHAGIAIWLGYRWIF